MAPNYKSLEDGQIVKADEPREDLEALARWVRTDEEPEEAPVVPTTTPAAGPVNKDAVNGGEPPVGSVTAGVAAPSEELSPAEAQAQAAADLGATATANPDAVDRPALDGSTEEWTAFAKYRGVDIPEDAGREDIIARYIADQAPAGNAGKEAWAAYATEHGVTVPDGAGRDKIREAVIEAGWAKA